MKKVLAIFSALCFLGFSVGASAQQTPEAAANVFTNTNTLASQFAAQAGTIAGVVQACGQSVVEYNARVHSAINALSKTTQDQMGAMVVFEKALSDSQLAQNRTHSIKCSDAMKSFNSLPLMQSDYQKTVLPQLTKMADSNATATTMPSAVSPKPPVPTQPTQTPGYK